MQNNRGDKARSRRTFGIRAKALASRKRYEKAPQFRAAAHRIGGWIRRTAKSIGPGKFIAACIIVWIFYEASKPAVTIENFAIDDSVKSHLLPATAVTNEVKRQISIMATSASIDMDPILPMGKGERPSIHGNSDASFRMSSDLETDFQIPTVGFSYVTLSSLIRQTVGRRPITVQGVIANEDDLFSSLKKLPTDETKISCKITFENLPGADQDDQIEVTTDERARRNSLYRRH